MKPTSKQQKELIIKALPLQHHAIKYIKTKYNLRQRDIEILAACYHLGEANDFFALSEVQNFMKESYFHCAMHDTFTLLAAQGFIERITKRRQWFKAHKYGVTYSGKALLSDYTKTVFKSFLETEEEVVLY